VNIYPYNQPLRVVSLSNELFGIFELASISMGRWIEMCLLLHICL